MFEQKLFARRVGIENQRDAIVARVPKVLDILVAQKIQRPSQGSAPLLVPGWLAAGMTTAIANPTTDAMLATPRSSFSIWPIADFNLEFRRVLVKILAVICDSE